MIIIQGFSTTTKWYKTDQTVLVTIIKAINLRCLLRQIPQGPKFSAIEFAAHRHEVTEVQLCSQQTSTRNSVDPGFKRKLPDQIRQSRNIYLSIPNIKETNIFFAYFFIHLFLITVYWVVESFQSTSKSSQEFIFKIMEFSNSPKSIGGINKIISNTFQ